MAGPGPGKPQRCNPLKPVAAGGWWRRLIDTIRPVVRLSGPLPICYLNGAYLPLQEATVVAVSIVPFFFGDAVYESRAGVRLASFPFAPSTWDRLNTSLAGIRMPPAMFAWRLGACYARN